MNPQPHPNPVPEAVAAKLRAIRVRRTTLALLQGLLLSVALFAAGMLAAMLLDLVVGWFDTRARYLVTGLVLALSAMAGLRWCLRPLLHRGTMVTAAREVDSCVPRSEERWTTVTELAESPDRPDVRGSAALIRQVGVEAESVGSGVEVGDVVPLRSLWQSGRWFLAAAAALSLLFVLNFTQASVLLRRFWQPGTEIALTRVTATPADVWVAKGEPVTLSARIEGRIPSGPARILIRPAQGPARDAAMIPVSAGTFRHGIDEVTDSFEYRIRAGDGQTPWQRITAAERPRISEVTLKVIPAAYSGLAKEERTSLPGTVRVLAGSELEIGFRSDQPLDRFWLDLGEGRSLPLTAGADQWYRFRDRPTNSFQFSASALNRFQLENKVKPATRISVFEDEPPTVRLLDPSDDGAVAPSQKVVVAFEANDDFGVARAELIVATTTAEGVTNLVTVPVDLGADAGKKEIRKNLELDPAALGLKQGDQLSYAIRVTDTRQAPAQATPGDARSDRESSQAVASKSAPGQPGEKSPATAVRESRDAKDNPATPEARPDTDAPGKSTAAAESKSGEPKPGAGQDGESKPTSLAGNAAAKPAESRPTEGSQPPPDDMTRRSLDVGQCTVCKARNIKVDEWAGSFEGEKRKKLEIEIAPILAQIDAHLATAQGGAAVLQTNATTNAGLGNGDAAVLKTARTAGGSASEVIAALRVRTTSTPYAFIGLQLSNIDGAHIVPAQAGLDRVVTDRPAKPENTEALEQAGFHLARAREMLADLTRTFETVKRDQQVADAMQRLTKMYQIFLEDTQALLGNSKGPINSYDRKVAEVDEEFVEKLKALLEEKKKIMAELARVLGDDPRMLRRYLAMLQLKGTSYRDQMTLLAERQKHVQAQVREWNGTAAADRAPLIVKLKEFYSAQHREAVDAATRLRENLETWLPLEVRPDQPAVKDALGRAERVVGLIGQSAGEAGAGAGLRSLDELRALRDMLPGLAGIPVTNRAKLDAYVANRLPEVESLITAQSGRLKIIEALAGGEFPPVAEIVQQRLTAETVGLEQKLDATETQVAAMSPEIARKAADLLAIVRTEIIEPQKSAVDQLARREIVAAGKVIDPVVPAFERAEQTFDELMRLIIAKTDEAPPPTDPGAAAGLESILAMLEDEVKAAENLGIPCRPINVSIMRDWMKPGSNPGQGMGQGKGQGRAQAQAARSQAEAAKAESKRLEQKARESGRQALAKAREESGGESDPGPGTRVRGEDWNKLASRLQKDLLQGRENSAPEQYREAISRYFKTLAGQSTEGRKANE